MENTAPKDRDGSELSREELAKLDPLDRLSYAQVRLAKEGQRLRTEAGAAAKAQAAELRALRTTGKRANLTNSLLLLLIVVMIAVLASVYSARSSSARKSLDGIHDCLIAGGDCYNQIQQQNAKATAVLFNAAIQCNGLSAGDQTKFLICMEKALGAGG